MILQASGIYKSYGNVEVLKNIHLEIKTSEIISIVGASGAGKSTLLHILGTLDTPDRGNIYIEGKNITHMNKKDIASFRNTKIGFVFQFHNLLPEFNTLENVCMPGYIAKKNKKEVEKKGKELLDILHIKNKDKNKINELSGGEQQRVAIARSLINNPSLIFADEPSGNLDSHNAEELHKYLFTLRDTFHQTFVIVTHNKELATMADRTIEIKDGFCI